ncbi:hypothetical protein PCS_00016 [Desulfocurvibacter africanus PCS]|uniref:Uncharacterized protein n=1 Tax=Desulfocurvibacter africanus PCS TaxID=1262666 RepID=M5PYM6_DESAF|nr:hypothetical protein [Desulfocurvibacter africanus]EMG39130.1 hypothetical protein PCS_00016 [Desulfocurvibacter africanus PCS]
MHQALASQSGAHEDRLHPDAVGMVQPSPMRCGCSGRAWADVDFCAGIVHYDLGNSDPIHTADTGPSGPTKEPP